MGLDDIKNKDFGEEDYAGMRKAPILPGADPLERFDKAAKPTEPDNWGTWLGKFVLLGVALTLLNFLAILGYMCWQWVLNR